MFYSRRYYFAEEHAVALLVEATSREVAGFSPEEFVDFFFSIYLIRQASNRNEYQESS
jgi:hypothetical protein